MAHYGAHPMGAQRVLMAPGMLGPLVVGGMAGASSRWALGELLQSSSWWPWGVFVANALGRFVLGLVLTSPLRRPAMATALGTGFCGGLTTLSSLTLEVARLADQGAWSRSITYLLTTTVVGLSMAVAGVKLGEHRSDLR